ncbi:MAG: hypothetical protein J6I71_03655, partial [Campylobacter sp.]|uniref:hypothetical protein n=1 Tax=Campylobacter sp. TaxID=205 RepID=UPI001B452B86
GTPRSGALVTHSLMGFAHKTDMHRGTPRSGALVTHSLMGFAHKADMHRGTPRKWGFRWVKGV